MWICTKCETYNNDSDTYCCVCNEKRRISDNTVTKNEKIKFKSSIDEYDQTLVSENKKTSKIKTEGAICREEKIVLRGTVPKVEIHHASLEKTDASAKSAVTEHREPLEPEIDYHYLKTRQNNNIKQRKLRKVLIAVNVILAVINIFGIPFFLE